MIDGSNNPANSLLDVLLLLEKRTLKDTHVAEVMRVTRMTSGNITCSALYNNNIIVTAVPLMSLSVQQDDIVLVLFTDHNFVPNLSRIKINQSTVNMDDETSHSTTYGVVIGIIYRKETN